MTHKNLPTSPIPSSALHVSLSSPAAAAAAAACTSQLFSVQRGRVHMEDVSLTACSCLHVQLSFAHNLQSKQFLPFLPLLTLRFAVLLLPKTRPQHPHTGCLVFIASKPPDNVT